MALSSTSLAGEPGYGVAGAVDSRPNWSRQKLRDHGVLAAEERAADNTVGPRARNAEQPSGMSGISGARSRASSANALETSRKAQGEESPAARRERLLARLASSAAPRGFRIARDLLGNRDEAEDAVQEALARACEQAHKIRDPEAIDSWFYRVLTNLCMRTLRRRRLRRLILGREQPAAEDRPTSAQQPLADRQLVHNQDVAQLMRALDVLPSKQRAALLLRYGHDLAIDEIASMLGVRPATVKTHLVRGLRRLRKTMERNS